MREIKFRGKSKIKDRWVVGSLIVDKDRRWIAIQKNHWNLGTFDNIEVVPESIGQFIELKDENGREIYEGDVVHAYTAESNGFGNDYYISAEITGVVTFRGISFGLQVGDIFNDLWTNAETFVVEGNIYENPELLEGK